MAANVENGEAKACGEIALAAAKISAAASKAWRKMKAQRNSSSGEKWHGNGKQNNGA